jgi:hypothetical protein
LTAHFPAANDTSPPKYLCTDDIKVKGEPLHPVIWQGRQWAVTTYGVEPRDGGAYVIERTRLWENETTYGWVNHIGMKGPWVDLPDFAEALKIARRVHAAHSPRPENTITPPTTCTT